MREYHISVDLGQSADYTAISVLETDGNRALIRHLQRLPLGDPYPSQVETIKGVYKGVQLLHEKTTLVVDFTGVGRAVSDLITKEGLPHIKLTITGGNTPSKNGDEWSIPKRELISCLLVAIQTGQLRISNQLPEAETLIKELLNFKLKINAKTGHDSYEAWREGDHDDLVLSVAMAAYAAGLGKPPVRQVSRPTPGGNNRGIPSKRKPRPGYFEHGRPGRIAGL